MREKKEMDRPCSPTPVSEPRDATSQAELRRYITDWNVPKNEAEWWACREIERLSAAIAASIQERDAMREALKPFARMGAIAEFYVEDACPGLAWPSVRTKLDPDGPPMAAVGIDEFRHCPPRPRIPGMRDMPMSKRKFNFATALKRFDKLMAETSALRDKWRDLGDECRDMAENAEEATDMAREAREAIERVVDEMSKYA